MKVYQILAAVMALVVTGLLLWAMCDPPAYAVWAYVLGLVASARLALSLALLEVGAKLAEMALSLRELWRRLPLLRRAWTARRWLGLRLSRELVVHCLVALATILLTMSSLDVGTLWA